MWNSCVARPQIIKDRVRPKCWRANKYRCQWESVSAKKMSLVGRSNDPPAHPHIWPCQVSLYGKFNVHGGVKKTVKRHEQDMYIKLYNNEGSDAAAVKNQYPPYMAVLKGHIMSNGVCMGVKKSCKRVPNKKAHPI